MRIAIVNDVPLAVEALRRVVTSVAGYEIAWIAGDGQEAVSKCAADVPDLILMDLMMPRMDGAEATRLIMRDTPCAILVVTATVDGHLSKVFEAMGHGARDAVQTPVLGRAGEPSGASELLAKIAMFSRLIGKSRPSSMSVPALADPAGGRVGFPLVAIGASTGGPAALARILSALPQPFPAAVIIVQHVDQHFTAGLASWLATESQRAVRVIRHGDRPDTAAAQIASTNDHLVLAHDGTFHYTREPAEYVYRPSIDVFFESVVQHWHDAAVGVLLTGMGTDGAHGLLAMRRAGWPTIAQDEQTSVVYGMPKASAQIGAAAEILPLDQIAGAVCRAVTVRPPARARNRP